MQATDIKNLRTEMGLNQSDFGALFGFANPQIRISKIESGNENISGQVEAMCRILRENNELKKKLKK
jgi:DNA-binding transcriptional regulator YiaG